MKNNIPKTIHYCRFWHGRKSDEIEKCIKSWKKYCPDYEIIEWNESNFDINICQYTKDLYKRKKWAFVSDYARMYILYHNWWIYFDTDIEILKNIDELLENEAFIWFQDSDNIWWSIIWAKKWNKILNEILMYYNKKKIWIILPNLLNKIFKKYNSIEYTWEILEIENFKIFPKEYFYPYAYYEKLSEEMISKKTYSIHHYHATWLPSFVEKIIFPIIGYIKK